MEHGYVQHLETMIYSFSEKYHSINIMYIITEGGILSLVTENVTSEFCCVHLTFLIAFFLPENILASHFFFFSF